MSTKGLWRNGKRTLTGSWSYYRPADRFDIWLDSKDRITGQNRHISTHNDTPEWGNWKLVMEEKS
jgi:hypothetical protein